MKRKFNLGLLAAAFLLTVAGAVHAQGRPVSFDVQNRTGHTIRVIAARADANIRNTHTDTFWNVFPEDTIRVIKNNRLVYSIRPSRNLHNRTIVLRRNARGYNHILRSREYRTD